MRLPIKEYEKIKNNYCVVYEGDDRSIISLLKILTPSINATYPDINLYIACKKHYMYLLQNQNNILSVEDLHEKKSNFAYVNKIKKIENLFKPDEIIIKPYETKQPQSNRCMIYVNSYNRTLNSRQIKNIFDFVTAKNFSYRFNGDWKDCDWVIGVPNEQIYEAAYNGKFVTLIDIFGDNLFKKLFPDCDVLYLSNHFA